MRLINTIIAVATVTLVAGGCGSQFDQSAAEAQVPEPSEATSTPPLTPIDGRVETIDPDPSENAAQAATVVDVEWLASQGHVSVKIFGTAGGDPAMNGLYTYLAFFVDQSLRVFRLGDFLDYRVLSSGPGRVDLEIEASTINSAGEIGSQTRRVIVTWTVGPDSALPDSLVITPAQ